MCKILRKINTSTGHAPTSRSYAHKNMHEYLNVFHQRPHEDLDNIFEYMPDYLINAITLISSIQTIHAKVTRFFIKTCVKIQVAISVHRKYCIVTWAYSEIRKRTTVIPLPKVATVVARHTYIHFVSGSPANECSLTTHLEKSIKCTFKKKSQLW